MFLQHLHSANYSYYRLRLEEKETVFFGRLAYDGHIMNLIAHALGAYYGHNLRGGSLHRERARANSTNNASCVCIYCYSLLRCRVISICGCVTPVECKTPPRETRRTKEEAQEKNKGIYMNKQWTLHAAGVFYFAQSSDAVNGRRRMQRHAKCTRRKKRVKKRRKYTHMVRRDAS